MIDRRDQHAAYLVIGLDFTEARREPRALTVGRRVLLLGML